MTMGTCAPATPPFFAIHIFNIVSYFVEGEAIDKSLILMRQWKIDKDNMNESWFNS